MSTLIIHTPRTGTRRPALILPPSQVRNASVLSKLVQQATAQRSTGSPGSWRPIQLINTIGASLSMGSSAETYLLTGVDTAKMDPEAIREIQNRLASQIFGYADKLITSAIPWNNRESISNSAQFVGKDVVIRSELASYSLMFSKLPELSIGKSKSGVTRYSLLDWRFLTILMICGAGAGVYAWYSQREAGKRGQGDQIVSLTSSKMAPISTPAPSKTTGADRLEQDLENLKQLRDRLTNAEPNQDPEVRMRWECEVLRYNKKRENLLGLWRTAKRDSWAFNADPLFIFGPDVDLKEGVGEFKARLERIQGSLSRQRKTIDAKDLSAVEEYNAQAEWYNIKASAFNRIASETAAAPAQQTANASTPTTGQ